jgi:hypothetical protein
MLDVAGLIQRAKFLLNENSATILTGMGVTGTVATAYLSGRASFKAAEVIEHARQEYIKEEALPDLEKQDLSEDYKKYLEEKRMLKLSSRVKLVWKFYIPPVAIGSTTITSIIMANKISSKKIAALAVASGISERALQEYKAKVVEKLGEKHETAIRDEIAQDRINAHPPAGGQVFVAGSGDVLCYDMTTGRYFQSSMEDIKKAENKINYEIIQFMSASLSSFYDEIGLPPTNYTDSVGWNMNSPLEVKFSTVMSPDNRPCIAIDFSRPPIPEYDKHWD